MGDDAWYQPNDLSAIPRNHLVGENWLLQIVLLRPHASQHASFFTCAHMQISVKKKKKETRLLSGKQHLALLPSHRMAHNSPVCKAGADMPSCWV